VGKLEASLGTSCRLRADNEQIGSCELSRSLRAVSGAPAAQPVAVLEAARADAVLPLHQEGPRFQQESSSEFERMSRKNSVERSLTGAANRGHSGLEALIPERDEDLELVFPNKRLYLQVKTRNRALRNNDIEGALERFAKIRKQHDVGNRSRQPEFWIISNVPPSESLEQETKAWPPDVFFKSPDFPERRSCFATRLARP
jgi:hypothetical protein